ncbi:unnamed protein product [Bursaphelenchus okinawaensis]|uniref:PHD-type domain-containing protein n=1 Tax=Bursaphelenchus okinawaensis TaxID=465554 RepID=A0A811KNU5_9BILA|nr:unnamed protein product [Bursaphelenchus okinawaensis]CAG9106546.1 unnamed protein product [Bursaphelenchus okinawaensis]
MSVLMGPSEYPLATRDPTQQQQNYGYQWTNNRSSPNSLGSTNNSPSPLNSSAPAMNPTAPSPLVSANMGPPTSSSNNQENTSPASNLSPQGEASNPGSQNQMPGTAEGQMGQMMPQASGMGMQGQGMANQGMTPQANQGQGITPQGMGMSTMPNQVLREQNPNEIQGLYDYEMCCGSLNPQMPLPFSHFDQIRHMLLQTRYTMQDHPALRAHFAPGVNTAQGQNHIINMYPPGVPLNRGQCMMITPRPMMPQPMPVQQPAPAPPAKKKRQTKKEKEEQKKREEEEKRMQMMMQQQQQFQNQFMPMMPMDRPSSSEMVDHRLMSPSALPPHMKGPDGFAIPGPVMNRFKVPERIVEQNQPCLACSQPVQPDNKGIRCTIGGMGCGAVYHAACVQISPEALHLFMLEQQCEWICGNCTAKRRTPAF